MARTNVAIYSALAANVAIGAVKFITGGISHSSAVLGFLFVMEGTSFVVAIRKFRKTIGDRGWWEAIRTSKDPADFMVLFEDGAAVLGIVIVFVLLLIGEWTKNPYLDGVASLLVGCILTVASAVLARESRSLLIGEGISAKTEGEIKRLVEGAGGSGMDVNGADGSGSEGSGSEGSGSGGSGSEGNGPGGHGPVGTKVERVFSLYQAPDEVLLVLIVDFPADLSTDELSDRIGKIRERIKSRYPRIAYVVIQPA